MKEAKQTCAYCGKSNEGQGFWIGASLEAAWTLVEGTGKLTCPDCYEQAVQEGQEVCKAGLLTLAGTLLEGAKS